MSAIKFFGEFDTKKLVEQIKASTKNFTDWAKDVASKTSSIDKSLLKSKDVMKASITEQKEILKQMESKLHDLEKAYEKAAFGKQKMEQKRNLNIVRADIEEEKEYIKQLEAQYESLKKKKTEDLGTKAIGSLKAWALGLMSVATAMKILKDVIESTEHSAIQLEKTLAAGSASLQVLLKMFATGDFSNFGQRISEAQAAAKDYVEEMNKVHNLRRELDLKEMDWNHEIEKQRAIVFEDQLTSDEEKLAAITEMRRLYHLKAVEEIELAKITQEAVAASTAGVNKLTKEQLEYAIENYDKLITTGEQYIKLNKQLEGEGNGDQQIKIKLPGTNITVKKITAQEQPPEYYENIRKEIALLGKEAPKLGAIVELFGEVNSKEREVMFEAIKSSRAARNMELEETRKLARFEKGIRNRIIDDKNAEIKAQTEYEAEVNQARKDQALEVQQSLLNAEQDGANKRIRQAELDYQKTLNVLDKQKADIIKKREEASGGIDKKTGERTASYVGALSPEDLELDKQLREAAVRERNAKIIQIDKEASEEIKKINREITDNFLSEQEKQISAVNAFYDEKIKRAKEAAATQEELDFIESKRKEELAVASQSATLKITNFYKDVFGDLSRTGYAAIERIRKEAAGAIGSARETNVKGKTYFIVSIPDLDAEGKAIERNVTLTIEEFTQLQKKYTELGEISQKKNPFKTIKEQYKELIAALKSGNKEDLGNAVQKFSSAVTDAISVTKSWGDSLGMILGEDYAEQIKKVTDSLEGAAKIGTGIGKFAAGDKIGGITDLLAGVGQIAQAISGMEDVTERWQHTLEGMNKAIEKQNRLIDQSARAGAEGQNRKKLVEDLQQQLKDQEWELRQAEITAGMNQRGFLWATWIPKKYKEVIEDVNSAIEQTKIDIEDANQAYMDFLTGGITQESIAELISKGFQEGKTSVNDFAGYMNDMLLDAVLNVFKGEILGDAIDALYAQIKAALSDKVLDSGEKAAIDAQVKEIAEANKKLWNDLTGSLDLGNSAGLSGVISRSITEDTASELAGLMRRIADDVRINRDGNREGVSHLIAIEANTFQTVAELKNAVSELKIISSNSKKVYADDLG